MYEDEHKHKHELLRWRKKTKLTTHKCSFGEIQSGSVLSMDPEGSSPFQQRGSGFLFSEAASGVRGRASRRIRSNCSSAGLLRYPQWDGDWNRRLAMLQKSNAGQDRRGRPNLAISRSGTI